MTEHLNSKERPENKERENFSTSDNNSSNDALRAEYLTSPIRPIHPVPIELACKLPGLEVNENRLAHLLKPLSPDELDDAADKFVATMVREGDDFGNTADRKQLENLMERAMRTRDEDRLVSEINKKLRELDPNLSLNLEKGRSQYVNSPGCYPPMREIAHCTLKLFNGCIAKDSINCDASRPAPQRLPLPPRPIPGPHPRPMEDSSRG